MAERVFRFSLFTLKMPSVFACGMHPRLLSSIQLVAYYFRVRTILYLQEGRKL